MAGSKTDHLDSELKRSCAGRQCPSTNGAPRPLITHRIGTDLCLQRQRENYHKCHRCIYKGKPASFELETEQPSSRNGAVKKP
ncbi:MAG: hypothetical protein ACYTG5_13045 [Planctomycetota bacterium]